MFEIRGVLVVRRTTTRSIYAAAVRFYFAAEDSTHGLTLLWMGQSRTSGQTPTENVRLRLDPRHNPQKNRPKVLYDPSPEIFSNVLKSSKKFGKAAVWTQDKCLVAGRRAVFGA